MDDLYKSYIVVYGLLMSVSNAISGALLKYFGAFNVEPSLDIA